MYKGEPTEGINFFELLFKSEEFSSEMGKVTLAAGQLEVELMLSLIRKGIRNSFEQLTLGRLISISKKENAFSRSIINALEVTRKQRNYLTHNIYALLSSQVDETILEGRNLLDSDVHTYTERAWQLKNNLIDIISIIKDE